MVGFGTALAGLGGAMPQIQQMQQVQDKKTQDAALAKVLQQYAAQRQGAPPAGAPPAGGAPGQPTQAPPAPGGFAQGQPDLSTMITMLSQSGIPADQQFEALKSYGAFASPFEKMQQQMTMAQQKMDFQSQMLDERLREMDRIARIRQDTQERGQDINASNVDKRVGAQERGQDMRATTAEGAQKIQQERADTAQQAQQSRAIQGEEGLKIKQQQADTAQDRAGTYKYGTMERTKLASEKQKETEKLDAAKIRKMESATTAENKKPFQAARDQYNRAAALYQSLTKPGATPAASPEDIAFAKQKMDAAADNMVKLSTGGAAPSGFVKPTAGEEVRTDGQGNYFVLRDGKPTPAEPPAGQ